MQAIIWRMVSISGELTCHHYELPVQSILLLFLDKFQTHLDLSGIFSVFIIISFGRINCQSFGNNINSNTCTSNMIWCRNMKLGMHVQHALPLSVFTNCYACLQAKMPNSMMFFKKICWYFEASLSRISCILRTLAVFAANWSWVTTTSGKKTRAFM